MSFLEDSFMLDSAVGAAGLAATMATINTERKSSVGWTLNTNRRKFSIGPDSVNRTVYSQDTEMSCFSRWRHMSCFVASFLVAWIYVIIPNAGYWSWSFIKMLWWAIVFVYAYMEIADNSVPGVPDSTYVIAYVLSLVMAIVVHVFIAYVQIYKDNFYINGSFTVTVAVMVVIIAYGRDVYLRPTMSTQEDNVTTSTVSKLHDSETVKKPENDVERQSEEQQRKPEISHNRQVYDALDSSSAATKDSKVAWVQSNLFRFPKSENQTEPNNHWFIALVLNVTPRVYFRKYCDHSNPVMVSGANRVRSWQYSSLFNIIFVIYYFFLIYFTQKFKEYGSNYSRTVLLCLFIFIGTMFRYSLKMLGLLIDSSKRYSISMFFLGEALCLLFYYIFYRVLFESIRNWTLFALFQVIHLGSEWFLYPFRASEFFFSVSEAAKDAALDSHKTEWTRFFYRNFVARIFNTNNLGHEDWQHFITLDFGIRCVVLTVSGIGISLLLVTVSYLNYTNNELSQSRADLRITLGYIALAVMLEVINACAMNFLYFRPEGLEMFTVIRHCLSNLRFAFLFGLLTAGLLINPFASFEDGNKF
jgi:hypothetical protein